MVTYHSSRKSLKINVKVMPQLDIFIKNSLQKIPQKYVTVNDPK